MTMLRGGPCGPSDDGSTPYRNEVETDRAAWFAALGGSPGVISGLDFSPAPGQMAINFAPGSALIPERDGDGSPVDRGYFAWLGTAFGVSFGAASPQDRCDALILAFIDVQEGAAGSAGLPVGPHAVAVPGASGSTVPRSDAQIQAYVGRGGWLRLADVTVRAGSTQIAAADVARATAGGTSRAVALLSTNQSVATSTMTTVTVTSATLSGAGFSRAGNVLTYSGPPRRFLVCANIAWVADVDGWRELRLQVNGATARMQTQQAAAVAMHQSISAALDLDTGDQISVTVRQNASNALALASGGTQGSRLTADPI